MRKKIFASAVLMAFTQHSVAEDKQQRIPLAVDSDFQYQPVRANFPEQRQQEIKFVDLGPMPNDRRIDPIEPTKPAEPPGFFENASNLWNKKAMEWCVDDATKRPTDVGVRTAMAECRKKYGAK